MLGLCILKSTTILTIPSREESSLSVEISETFGYVQSLDHAEKMISKFETKNTVNFPVTRLTRTLEIMVYTTEVNYRLN